MSRYLRAHWRPILLSIALFAINAYICRELFTIGFIRNMDSNEGAFVTLSRFFREHWNDQRWFPWFNAGMPIENAYQPLLPVAAALTQKIAGWQMERAFHFVLAVAYCCGPVTLFWFAWEWSRSLLLGFVAGLAYSLTSPAEFLIPVLRLHPYGPLRLYNLIHYAEDPHVVALTLLPLALLFLHRAVNRRTIANILGAVIFCAAVVLTNAFGAVDLAIGGLCIVLAREKGAWTVIPIGLAAWLWISPWLPPSLIDHIRNDQWGARGLFAAGARAYVTIAVAGTVFAGLWFATRRLTGSLDRFAILFALWMCLIPLGYFLLDLTIAPQGNRYQLEMEMALCLLLACAVSRIPYRPVVIAVLLALAIRETIAFRRFERGLIQTVDITQTIQYKMTSWLNRNLPGQRAMISGDVEYLYNVISDNPQMSGGHQPTSPNWQQLVATYIVYAGTEPESRDAEYSILWLKAFGNQAVTVPGEKSRESSHGIVHPHKFDGVLPVLWHDEDDTIFAIPQRSASLAHVVPRAALVSRPPVNGLDVDPLRPYVAALDDPALPLASLTWNGPSHGIIETAMNRDQALSVQVNYAPGWRATVNGRNVPVRPDGIGLMALEPGCDGPCRIDLSFGLTREAWICRLASALTTAGLAGLILLKRSKRGAANAGAAK
ncbi:MAG TPA: hypothetical protein VHB50_13530 [Bryobacteraceae bacterium]|nr:hypothetical protein [Bryobacteraceae bacterium]